MEQKSFLKFMLSCKFDKHLICELIMILIIVILLIFLVTDYFSTEKKALRGNVAAQIKLAEKCIKNNRLREAEFWLLRAGDNGDCNAFLKLGDFFTHGPESLKDPIKAIKWYKQAAEFPYAHPGKAQAFMHLSTAYELGNGVPRDHAKALELLKQAAELDVPEAQCKLGCFYSAQQKKAEAFEWFARAADANYSEAFLILGKLYLNDNKVDEALRMFDKAAQENNLEALHLLGQFYYLGMYVEKNEKKAVYYFLKAATAGLPGAQYDLAVYYVYKYLEYGRDEDDYKQAIYWAKRAWASGREDIKKYIDF